MRVCCLALLVCTACAPRARPTSRPASQPASQPTTATSEAFARAEAATPEAVRIGDRCAAKRRFARGTCAAGQRCAPFPGGYCTARCERGREACADKGARCVGTPGSGELCLRRCKASGDCRGHQGYVCDAQQHVCTLPGFIAPAPRHCAGAAPGRGKWQTPVALSSAKGPGHYQVAPSAALGADGRLVVAYIAAPKRGENNAIAVSVLGADGSLAVRERALSVGRESAYDPWITRETRGRLLLVWLGFDGRRAPEKNMQVGLARSDDGASWTAPRAVHDSGDCRDKSGKASDGCLDKPMILAGRRPRARSARGGGGDVIYLLYFSAKHDALRLRRSLDGAKTFSAATSAAASAAYGNATVDARGVLHLAYVAAPDAKQTPDLLGDKASAAYLVRSSDMGKTFSKPERVSPAGTPVPFYFSNTQVRHDARRKITYVIYPRGDRHAPWRLMLATRRGGAGSWTTRALGDSRCAHHMLPQAALDKRGALHVTWLENRDGKGLVAYRRCPSGGANCAAVERVSEAPFASYELVRHSPRWLGDYGALVVDEKRQLLHATWTQTVNDTSGGGGVRARVFAARRALR
ncbi:MAG: hypothetical protein KC503_24420 [Myxococcales bacterium]|nr:hypothetical protein [Myxococcales bacterium]